MITNICIITRHKLKQNHKKPYLFIAFHNPPFSRMIWTDSPNYLYGVRYRTVTILTHAVLGSQMTIGKEILANHQSL